MIFRLPIYESKMIKQKKLQAISTFVLQNQVKSNPLKQIWINFLIIFLGREVIHSSKGLFDFTFTV